MEIFNRLLGRSAKPAAATRDYPPSPHLTQKRSFFSGDVDRLLNGWTTDNSAIDEYLASDLDNLRARSAELVRLTPHGKKYTKLMKDNLIGPNGVVIQAQSKRRIGRDFELDSLANEAIEKAFKDWCQKDNCDVQGKKSWIGFQNLAASTLPHSGEFLIEMLEGRQYGKYGFQLRFISPAELDITKNELTATGEIRLGVEYNDLGRPIQYHFKKVKRLNNVRKSLEYTVVARNIIHGFVEDWADQSRGIPWMHAGLATAKSLEKYDESVMVAARYGASSALFLSSKGDDTYEGDEDGEGEFQDTTLDNVEAGSIHDIGDRELQEFDPKYPHELYGPFRKSTLQSTSSGWGVSYHSLSNDLEGVNYSSIRSGVIEDRDSFKGLQNWLIEVLIQPVYERFLVNAILNARITIGIRPLQRPVTEYFDAYYQGRRWAWVDPQKDGNANDQSIENKTKSRSEIIRETGRDPESVWNEIEREDKLLKDKGLLTDGEKTKPEESEQPET